jgi:hypothetical protein
MRQFTMTMIALAGHGGRSTRLRTSPQSSDRFAKRSARYGPMSGDAWASVRPSGASKAACGMLGGVALNLGGDHASYNACNHRNARRISCVSC